MAQVDGTIYINTAIETDGFTAGGKEVEAATRRMAKSVSGIGASAKIALQKQTDAFIKQNQAYAQQAQKFKELKQKQAELANQKIETEEYKTLSVEAEKLNAEMDSIIEKQKDLISLGFSEDEAYKAVASDIDRIGAALEKNIEKKRQMEESGTAYVTPDTLAIDQKVLIDEQKLEQMHTALGTSYEALKAKTQSYNDTTNQATNIVNSLKKSMSNVLSILKKGAVAVIRLSKATNKSNDSLGINLKRILKYAFGIRSLFVLFNRLRSAAVEGFQNLAQASGPTNSSISSLISSLTQLKNSFATAFAPVLNVAAPILTTFINMISKAVTYVGMFIATLTGQKSFTKAIGVQQDYANSLNNTAGAAENAAEAQDDYLSGLDEVNRFQTNNSGNAGGGGGGDLSPEDMFETVPIKNSIANMVQKIKDLIKGEDWEGLGSYLADGINRGLQKVYDAINWNNVGPKITYFVIAFARTFNSLVDNLDWNLLGQTIGAGINTIVNSLNLLIEGINWINLGKSFAMSFMGIIDEVNWENLGKLIGNKFMIAWKVFYGFVTNLDYTDIGLALSNLINGLIEKIDLGIVFSSLSVFAVALLEMLSTAIQNTDWTAVGIQIADALRAIDWLGIASGLFDVGLQLVSGLLEAFRELPMPVQIAASAIAVFFSTFKTLSIISKIIKSAKEFGIVLKLLISPVGIAVAAIAGIIAILVLLITHWDDVKATMEKFTQWLSGVFTHDWTEEFGILGEGLNVFFRNVSNIFESVKKIFGGVIQFITGAFSGNWTQAWEGIKQIFSGIWDGFAAIVKSPINAIIGFFNGLISSAAATVNMIAKMFNNLRVDIPDWVPGIGGKTLGFNIPTWTPGRVPYLATGAVIPPNAPFMAVLGDQRKGNNIEAPEDLLRKIVREESGQNKRYGGNYQFTAQINRRTIFDEIIAEAKLRQTVSGINPFELV